MLQRLAFLAGAPADDDDLDGIRAEIRHHREMFGRMGAAVSNLELRVLILEGIQETLDAQWWTSAANRERFEARVRRVLDEEIP
jgi:hypothetical protein